MAAFGEKRLSLFLKPKIFQEFYICRCTRTVAAYKMCEFKKNQTWGKSYEVLTFFCMGKKG